MSNFASVIPSKQEPCQQWQVRSWKFDVLWPLLCLLLIELIAFGVNAKDIGLLQDDWMSFGKLHFVPHGLGQIMSAAFWDSRVIGHPVQPLHFATLYFFVGDKPLAYHVFGYLCEFIGAWFLFLTLCRLSLNRGVALAAAVLFLVYPTHDATHYGVFGSLLAISASLFTLSLWLFVKGIDEGRSQLILWSALAYGLSLHNYECCLPLVVLYPLFCLLKLKPEQAPPRNFKLFLAYQIPFILVTITRVAYRSWLLPSLGLGWHYASCLSLSNFVRVMAAGLNVSLSPYMLSFCASMAFDELKAGLPIFSWLCLGIAVSSVLICLSMEGRRATWLPGKNLSIILVGAVALVFSYTIFGFSPEHKPAIDTWLNRVNEGGSLGACLLIAGALAMLCDALPSVQQPVRTALFALLVSTLAGFFILVDWQFAKPWIVAWRAQRELMSEVRSHASEIRSGDAIIIGGITRYARWAPVADGVWDFENLVRIALNNPSVNADVVTERLRVDNDALVDGPGPIGLGRFSFKQMILYAPNKSKWVRISTRQEFTQQARQLGWSIGQPALAN